MANIKEEVAFESADEAWLWCCFCELNKYDWSRGCHVKTARPCESGDILVVVNREVVNKHITPSQLKTIQKYGLLQAPPHPLFGATLKECRFWQQAMDV